MRSTRRQLAALDHTTAGLITHAGVGGLAFATAAMATLELGGLIAGRIRATAAEVGDRICYRAVAKIPTRADEPASPSPCPSGGNPTMIKNFAPLTLLAATAITACLFAAGCSSSKTATKTSPAASPSTSARTSASAASSTVAAAATTITIKNFGYTVSGAAASGSMVKVTNNDGEAHTVTADTGKAFDVTVQPGKSATFRAPAAAGSYKFHCTFHANMHSTLTVSH